MLTDKNFILGVLVGVAGGYLFHRFQASRAQD